MLLLNKSLILNSVHHSTCNLLYMSNLRKHFHEESLQVSDLISKVEELLIKKIKFHVNAAFHLMRHAGYYRKPTYFYKKEHRSST